ncbi:MAG: hypothetical protein ABIR71_02780 [Chthoniobacterales bacterium]
MRTTLHARTSLRWNRICLALVLSATLGLAAFHYAQFRQNPRPRWNGLVHDRSGHYQFAQDLARAVRQANPVAFFTALEKAKVWPPVHGLCAAAVLAVGGLDYRLAVLPSLAGWVATAVFGFLLARRCSVAHGNLAGFIAAAMVLASPAVRSYGLDIMLESLGAALTLCVLHLFLRARGTPSVGAWRWFALTLTVLFFEKYNYWLLVVLALVLNELCHSRAQDWRGLRAAWARFDWSRKLGLEMRQPLSWLCVLFAFSALAIFLFHPEPISIAGKRVSVYPPNNLITLAYAALFFRVLRSAPLRAITHPALRQLALWHVLPVAISFLLPRRLSTFVWFLGPMNTDRSSAVPIAETATFYLQSTIRDYHVAPWSAIVAALLFLLAVLTFRRMSVGGRAVLLLVLLSAALTLLHPNQKSRYLHSWLPVLWVAGTAGFANFLSGPHRWRRPFALTAGAGLIVAHAGGLLQPGRAAESGVRGETSSLLDITDTYLPEVGPERRVAIFSTVPAAQFFLWTYHERYPHSDKIEIPLKDYPLSDAEVQRRLTSWAATTRANFAVLVDFNPSSSDYSPIAGNIASFINSAPHFSLVHEQRFPQHGCTVSLWTRP